MLHPKSSIARKVDEAVEKGKGALALWRELGLRQGQGFGLRGLGFRAPGLGFRALGFRV